MRKGIGGATILNTALGGTTGGSSPRPISPAPVGIGIVGGTRMARTASGGSYGMFCLTRFPLDLFKDKLTNSFYHVRTTKDILSVLAPWRCCSGSRASNTKTNWNGSINPTYAKPLY